MTEVQEFRITLTVDDFDAAVRLYRDALGLPEVLAAHLRRLVVRLMQSAAKAAGEAVAVERASQDEQPGSDQLMAGVAVHRCEPLSRHASCSLQAHVVVTVGQSRQPIQ
jgi:catechol 2,3-dioxygenase-like lactoylglutathione lyase family enzyme